MFRPEEMVTSLPIGSLIFGTRFLITLLHPLRFAWFKRQLSKFRFNE